VDMCPRHVGGRYPTPGILVARRGIEPRPPAFQTSTLPSSSRAKIGGRCETRTRIARVQAVGNPLIRTAQNWGEIRESNSRVEVHSLAPKPLGQSHHRTWSWPSESNTRRRGTSSLHCHCARPANFWSWHRESNAGRVLTVHALCH
jgi:hypothetical protein